MYDVVAIGELLVDFACRSTDDDGYPVLAAHPGGAPANFLAVLARYGLKTALLAKVGNDAFGRLLRRTVEREGIDTAGVVVDDAAFTTLAFVTLDENGERDFSFARKPGADMLLRYDELDLSLIDRTRVFHFGSVSMTDEPSRDATRRAAGDAPCGGIRTEPGRAADLRPQPPHPAVEGSGAGPAGDALGAFHGGRGEAQR